MLCRCKGRRAGRHGIIGWVWRTELAIHPVDEDLVDDALINGVGTVASLESHMSRRVVVDADILAPIHPKHEIWAAGVTYESSKFARMAESEGGGDFYAKVYVADRPELFFKATPRRVVGPNAPVCIRSDSTWNVPEPELAAVIAANGKIVGYTIGNDMSSRSIEGENPLYLPQAKVYTGSCALGPWIVPAESVDPQNLGITMKITRGDTVAFEGETSTARMKRTVHELADWLFRENDFPGGAILLTGTGIIPPESFSLQQDDEIEITIEGIGNLHTPVA